jgi:hypothetical protein
VGMSFGCGSAGLGSFYSGGEAAEGRGGGGQRVEFEVTGYGVEATMGRGADGAPVCQVRRSGSAWPAAQRRWLAAGFHWRRVT